jgi:predicted permease
MFADLKYAVRMLLKSPGFTAVALLTLALGIGANTAIFTLLDATLLRPLPVSHPEQLALLTDPTDGGTSFGTSGGTRGLLAYTEYQALRDQNQVFSGLMAAESDTQRPDIAWSNGAGAMGAPQQAYVKLVSNNYFSVLGTDPYRGRFFLPSEGVQIGADPVAVVSYGYARHAFGDAATAVGRQFSLHGHMFTVIGVAPAGFFGENVGQQVDIWAPITMQPQAWPGMDRLHDPPGVSRLMWLQVMGRMKPGVTLAQAQAASNVIFQRSVAEQAKDAPDAASRRDILGQKLVLSSGAQGTSGLRGDFASPLWALFGLVGLVLVVAIVNLASLLLARATARQKEMGVRLALGAGRGRVIRQLLTESLLLAVVGGLLGVLLALWGERLLLGLVAAGGSDGINLSLTPDWRVLTFIAAICLFSGILFGLAPALRMARLNLNATLQAQGRGGSGRTRHVLAGFIRGGLPLGKMLVIGQVALSTLLLVGAGLFVRSLQALQHVPVGFQPDNLVLVGVNAAPAGYKGPTGAAFFHRLLDRLQSAPGVQAVALSGDGLFAHSEGGLPIAVQGYTPPGGGQGSGARFDQVSADYFKTVGIPILLGRALTVQDATSGVKNAVINQTLARQFFPGRNPIGQQMRDLYPDDGGVTYTIVGVCADAKYNSLGEKTPPRFYLSFFNGIPGDTINGANMFVRGPGGAGALTTAVRQAVQSLDPNVHVGTLHNMSEMIGNSLASQQLLAKLSSFFGILALLLAAIGLYGVMAYGVARRVPEIGVRMALGASGGSVMGMVLREVLIVVVVGLAIGIPASLAGGKVVATQMHLFGLTYYDPTTLVTATAILLLVACLAGLLPAHRASRVDALIALRQD